MNTAGKLVGYAAALALVAAGGWGVGAMVGPAEPDASHARESGRGGHADGGDDRGDQAANDPGGLASSADGYTLHPTDATVPAGSEHTFSFRILGPDGKPVTRFGVEHEKRMHLIVVRRDTSGFQHLHPKMAEDGTWRVPLRLAKAGSYRAFADFKPTGGKAQTLGVDLSTPGDYRPVSHQASRTATVDGYRVRLEGDLIPGRSSEVTLTVTKDGREVTDLQPYLGAYGHLVALRTGDLGYLHVHPEGTPGDGTTPAGPQVTFAAEVPSTGGYRLFLDFKHDGQVRTADFTVDAGKQPKATPSDTGGDDEHGHGD